MADDARDMATQSFGRGTTPRQVAEAVERAQDRDRPQRRASAAERDRFFRRMAAEVERAGGRS